MTGITSMKGNLRKKSRIKMLLSDLKSYSSIIRSMCIDKAVIKKVIEMFKFILPII